MHSLVALLAAVVLTNVADVASVIRRAERGVPFDLRVTMVTECVPERRSFTAEDATGPLSFMNHDPRWPNQRFAPGDLVRIVGRSETNDIPKVIARCLTLERIGHGEPPQPVDADIAGLKRGDFDHRLIRLRGTVRECFRDEIDHDHCYLVLDADGGSVYAILWAADVPLERLRPLTGAEIAVTGICCPDSSGYRRMLGRIVECVGLDAIRVLRPAADDPFAVEPFRRLTVTNPEDFTAMPRRRLSGTVLAVWKRRNLLFVDDDATVHNVRLAEATPPPRGLRIEAVGRPVTDLYRANLTDAIWRPDPSRAAQPLPPPVPTCAREIYTDKAGSPASSRSTTDGPFGSEEPSWTSRATSRATSG